MNNIMLFLCYWKKIARSFCVFIDKVIYIFFKKFTLIDERLIVFEGTTVGRFDESSWVLYHYLRKKNKYKFVWIVKNPSNYSKKSDTKYISRFHFTFNICADYYYAKAAYSFYTHTTSPIRYKRDGQKKIFMGHGYAIKGDKGNSRVAYNNFDYGLAIGEEAIPTQAIFVGCEEQELLPLGLPRNDLLLRYNGSGLDNPLVKRQDYKKVIIWMPTFRDSKNQMLSEKNCATETGLPLIDTETKISVLNSFLEEHACLLILKVHRLQLKKKVFEVKFSNILIVTENDIDNLGCQLYETIGFSDALLTDYSSVSVDYLLLDKPIGYILSDMEHYNADRGFILNNPLSVMAGEYIYNEDDLRRFILNVIYDVDNYSQQRSSLVKKLHAAPQGNSCSLIESYFEL